MSATGTITYYTERPDGDGQPLLESIELGIGGRVNIPEVRPEDRPAGPDDTTVLETEDPTGYLTVHKRSGNNQDTYEFCFRLDGNTATLTTLTRMEDGKDCSTYWIPDEVRDAIHHHHPNLTIRNP